MSRFPNPLSGEDPDREAYEREPEPEEREVNCDRCGTTGLEWVDIGMSRWKLYEGKKPHACKQISQATADDFEALG